MLEARDLAAEHAGRIVFSGVSLTLAPGGITGLFGPSGCGKTTLGRVLAGLHPPRSGRVTVDGRAPAPGPPRPVQYLHQAPLAAMNPRWRIGRVIAEPGPADPALAAAIGVEPDWLTRHPHELSGGQLHRVAILRALAARPRYLIADEITASLDSLAQARIWTMLQTIAAAQGIGMLVISHDRALLEQISGEIHCMPACG